MVLRRHWARRFWAFPCWAGAPAEPIETGDAEELTALIKDVEVRHRS